MTDYFTDLQLLSNQSPIDWAMGHGMSIITHNEIWEYHKARNLLEFLDK